MALRDTQIAAWDEIQDKLPEKRRIVFQLICRHPRGIPLFKVAELLGWPVNEVSGRITELAGLGYVEDSGAREVNPRTQKRAICWRPRDQFKFDEQGQEYFA